MTNQQKQWFPLSSANVVNEDGFPVSYYDLDVSNTGGKPKSIGSPNIFSKSL